MCWSVSSPAEPRVISCKNCSPGTGRRERAESAVARARMAVRRRLSMAKVAMPLDELDQWLRDRTERKPAATNLSMLDGYVTGIVVDAVSFDPREWICPLLAIDEDAFNHGGTPEFAAISAVAVRDNGPGVPLEQRYQLHALDHTRPVRTHLPTQPEPPHRRSALVWRLLCRHAAADSDHSRRGTSRRVTQGRL